MLEYYYEENRNNNSHEHSKYIGNYIGLDIICVSGFAKGVGFNIGDKISGENHEWNIINLNGVYYQIDSTWGAGNLKDKDLLNEYNDYYFLSRTRKIFLYTFSYKSKMAINNTSFICKRIF